MTQKRVITQQGFVRQIYDDDKLEVDNSFETIVVEFLNFGFVSLVHKHKLLKGKHFIWHLLKIMKELRLFCSRRVLYSKMPLPTLLGIRCDVYVVKRNSIAQQSERTSCDYGS
jgi:hypothetical protein